MNPSDSTNTLALDIGATKIALAIVDGENRILRRSEVKSQQPNLANELLKGIKSLLSGEKSIASIGIASAGPIDRRLGNISPVNIPQWRDFPIVENLKNEFTEINPVLIQDAVAVALAEHRLGAGSGFSDMLGMVVSTGVGGGLIINNHIHHGLTGNAGFFGHHSISYLDEECNCGRRGCVEMYARGPAMVSRAIQSGWECAEDFKALAQSAREGNDIAQEAIDFGARALAVGIANVMAIVDVNVVVVGGGVSLAGEVYWAKLREHFNNEIKQVGFVREAQIIPATLGADAGLLGAVLAAREML